QRDRMLRRPSLLAILILLLGGWPLHAVEFVRVWPNWREAESFDRISEYFRQGEYTGREIVLRTHNETRAGFYFLVRVKSEAAVNGARFELSVIRPDAPEPKMHTFPANVPAKETVFELGITGNDWPGGSKANPVAWKLALLSA